MRIFRGVAVAAAMLTTLPWPHLSAQSSAFSLVWSPSGRLRFERPFSWTEMKLRNPDGEQVQVQGGYKGHGHAVWVTVLPAKAIAGAGDCSPASHLRSHTYFATNTFQAGPNPRQWTMESDGAVNRPGQGGTTYQRSYVSAAGARWTMATYCVNATVIFVESAYNVSDGDRVTEHILNSVAFDAPLPTSAPSSTGTNRFEEACGADIGCLSRQYNDFLHSLPTRR